MSVDSTHPLANAYALWYSRKIHGIHTLESYSQNLLMVCVFRTIEDFWETYSYLLRPNDIDVTCDYHLFKEGIKPMWEDEANVEGGKWIVRLRKGLVSRYWENLLLGVLGGQFELDDDEICGAVVSLRTSEDIISVWNKRASNQAAQLKIKDMIKKVLGLPSDVVMEYKVHKNSLFDHSSYRNTDVFQ